jgi:hypothetical protein
VFRQEFARVRGLLSPKKVVLGGKRLLKELCADRTHCEEFCEEEWDQRMEIV